MKELTFKEKHGIKQEVSINGEWYYIRSKTIIGQGEC